MLKWRGKLHIADYPLIDRVSCVALVNWRAKRVATYAVNRGILLPTLLGSALTMFAGQSFADEAANAAAVGNAQQAQAIFEQHCWKCHGPDKQKGSLRLDSQAETLAGGESGPVILQGKSAASPLIVRVTSDDKDERMPPDGARLSAAQVDVLKTWIDAGAVWPSADPNRPVAHDKRRDEWTWQPIRRPAVPAMAEAARADGRTSKWARTPIDAFILAKLQQAGLSPQPEADRRTLIRRLAFDLHGLPPTPEEVEAFVADPDPLAYEKLVDRLLASSHYGERWARHWLDVAHYADTHGFERDQRRDNAWPYRDWVIRALNSDKPYDQFLREQIAGDELRPEDPEAIAATGFLAAGPWDFVGQAETPSPVLKRLARADDLDDMVTQVMTAACGVTVNCARCHDHKLDPISQREYYALWAVFSGVRRGERDANPVEVRQHAERKATLAAELQTAKAELARRAGKHFDLADIVGGGDGLGSGKPGSGIDPLTGNVQTSPRGLLEGVKPNTLVRSSVRFVDCVVVPDESSEGTPISSTGLRASGVAKTSGQAWDAIRNGPVNSQFSTKLGDVDYASGHTLLSLHANAAITFDLAELRKAGAPAEMSFTAAVGYFGQTPRQGASAFVYVDGELKFQRDSIGRDDGIIAVQVPLPAAARFLTLMATDAANGIGHDQICFADAWLSAAAPPNLSAADKAEIERLERRAAELEQQLKSLPAPAKVYGVVSSPPEPVHVLRRGDTEQPGEAVQPAALAAVVGLSPQLEVFAAGSAASNSAAGPRRTLAAWITSPANPLTRRVILNRLWHYHFGVGLVATPSDFGAGGSKPSHPALLDWLADELVTRQWSLKAMHRLICTSAVYRQSSRADGADQARSVDSDNRLLWRMNPRRIDAESLRDTVLVVSGKLNRQMFGPGYRDFEYQEEYAPVYRYITADTPELWRRSVYRFVVRTTTQLFLTTLDCPNPANLTPARNVTTTALQSLALLNNEFMVKQAGYFAQRVESDAPRDTTAQIARAFKLAFGRAPTKSEDEAAAALVRAQGLPQLCRMLLNANEFVYVD